MGCSDTVSCLRAVPGGSGLAELAEGLTRLDPGAVAALGRQVSAAADGVAASARAVQGAVAESGDGWRGPAAQGCAGYAGSFSRAAGRTAAAARHASREIGEVADVLTHLREELGAVLDRALGAVEGSGGLPGTAPAAVGVAGTEAHAAVERADVAVRAATDRLRAAVGELQGFAQLPEPGAPARRAGARGGPDDARSPAPGSTGGDGPTPPTTDDPAPPTVTPTPGTRPSDTGPSNTPSDTGSSDTGPANTGPPVAAAVGGPPGRVGDWIRQATAVLAAHGVATDQMDPDAIATIIDRESGGNPDAVNNSDSNAAHGTPSQGLMQTIAPTFESYKLPGHDRIRNPVDNIIAGVRYAIDRYGSVSKVPGVRAVAHGQGYVGY